MPNGKMENIDVYVVLTTICPPVQIVHNNNAKDIKNKKIYFIDFSKYYRKHINN